MRIMTTEREYQEGQRRIKKTYQKKTNQSLWIFMGIVVFLLLILFQNRQELYPTSTPSTPNQIDR